MTARPSLSANIYVKTPPIYGPDGSFTFKQDNAYWVSLEFSIPFITIPVKKVMDTTSMDGFSALGLPTININLASLALGGAVVLGTTVLIPLLLKSYAANNSNQNYARLLDNTEFGAESVLNFANQLLSQERGIQGCALRIACWTGQRLKKDTTNKIWEQINNNHLLTMVVNSSAVEEAILFGKQGRNCSRYQPCPLKTPPIFLDNFTVFTKS